jgi:hypothetical protein
VGVTTATIQVTDSLGQSATLAIEITIVAPPAPSGGGGFGGGGGGGVIDTTQDEQPSTSDASTNDAGGATGDVNPGNDSNPGDNENSTGTGDTAPIGGNNLPTPSPGSVIATSGGQPITVTQTTKGDSLVIAGGGVTTELTVKVGNEVIKLTSGTQLNLTIAGRLEIIGAGLDPASRFIGWLYSPAVKFIDLRANNSGNLTGSIQIPNRPFVGNYVLQLIGIKNGQQLVFSIGVNLRSTRPLANAVYFKNGIKLDAAELKKVTKYRKAIKPRATFTCIGYTSKAKPTAVERKQALDRAKNLCAAATRNLRPAKVSTIVRPLATAPAAKRSSNKLKLQRADLQFKNPAR